MNSDPLAENSSDAGLAGETVICSKCEAVNPKHGHRCVDCGAHLYVRCYYCRARNERGLSKCSACGKSTHPPLVRRVRRRLEGETGRLLWLLPSAVIVLALIIYSLNRPETAEDPLSPGQLIHSPRPATNGASHAAAPLPPPPDAPGEDK